MTERRERTAQLLEFLAGRLVNVYGESKHRDYVQAAHQEADQIRCESLAGPEITRSKETEMERTLKSVAISVGVPDVYLFLKIPNRFMPKASDRHMTPSEALGAGFTKSIQQLIEYLESVEYAESHESLRGPDDGRVYAW